MSKRTALQAARDALVELVCPINHGNNRCGRLLETEDCSAGHAALASIDTALAQEDEAKKQPMLRHACMAEFDRFYPSATFEDCPICSTLLFDHDAKSQQLIQVGRDEVLAQEDGLRAAVIRGDYEVMHRMDCKRKHLPWKPDEGPMPCTCGLCALLAREQACGQCDGDGWLDCGDGEGRRDMPCPAACQPQEQTLAPFEECSDEALFGEECQPAEGSTE